MDAGGSPGAVPMDISPGRDGGEAVLQHPPRQEPYEGCWVTVFGFGPDDLPDVLREFGRCGELLHWGSYGDGPGVNWVHLRYSSPQAAGRALRRDGCPVSPTVLVGVRPVEASRAAELDVAAAGGASAAAERRTATGWDFQPAWAARGGLKAQPATPAVAAVPAPARSGWGKLYEAVFGL